MKNSVCRCYVETDGDVNAAARCPSSKCTTSNSAAGAAMIRSRTSSRCAQHATLLCIGVRPVKPEPLRWLDPVPCMIAQRFPDPEEKTTELKVVAGFQCGAIFCFHLCTVNSSEFSLESRPASTRSVPAHLAVVLDRTHGAASLAGAEYTGRGRIWPCNGPDGRGDCRGQGGLHRRLLHGNSIHRFQRYICVFPGRNGIGKAGSFCPRVSVTRR